MDIMELGAIGEFVSGLAVIGSLLYVGIQLRQAKEVLRMESARSTSQEYRGFLFELMDPERMELFRRGLSHFDEMSPNDQARFHAYLTPVFIAAQNTFAMGQRGATERGMTDIVESFNWAALRSPGAASWWSSYKYFLPEDFVEYVDARVKELDGQPTAPEALPWYNWTPNQPEA